MLESEEGGLLHLGACLVAIEAPLRGHFYQLLGRVAAVAISVTIGAREMALVVRKKVEAGMRRLVC